MNEPTTPELDERAPAPGAPSPTDPREQGRKYAELVDDEERRTETEDETPEPGTGEEREDERETETDEPSGAHDALVDAAAEPEHPTFQCPTCKGAGSVPVPEDPRTRPCPECYGQGRVLTGSSVQGQETRECTRCKGSGYLEKVREPGEESRDEREWRAPISGGLDY